MAEEVASRISCADFAEFKDGLKTLRLVDDRIIYNLNVSLPTESFKDEINAETQCKTLYQELLNIYQVRENLIKKCISTVSTNVDELRAKRDQSPDNHDPALMKNLRSQQSTVRLMQAELMVEEVVKQRSFKVFNERCWKSFRPPKPES